MITGRTRVYAQIGDPISHVRSPEVFNALLEGRGIDVVAIPVHVRPANLVAFVAGCRAWENLLAIGVTMPHKETIAQHLDSLGANARLVGAVNVVRREPDGRLVGDMFDGLGFVLGLQDAGYEPRGAHALLVGTGGTGKAIAFALAAAGVARLTIANRTRPTAERLARAIAAAYPGCAATAGEPDPAGCGLVVNATNLGMRADDPSPVNPALLAPEMLVAEVIMLPETTPLLHAAAARGCRIQPGRAMLDSQAGPLFEFLGVQL